eukprot:evm.model.NODE_21169_length_9095_cov_20.787575.3
MTATSTTTIPSQQAAADPAGATFSYDPAQAATALGEEIDQDQLSEYEALKASEYEAMKTLHEDMLIGLMSDSSFLPPSSSSSSPTTIPTREAEGLPLDLNQIPNNDAIKALHEDMLISLMSSSSTRPQQAFVPQPTDGHRRLQFRGIPGIPRIPGIPGIPLPGMPGIPRGVPGMGYVRTGARVINQGVNVVRQGANTAQEMNQVRETTGEEEKRREGGREGGGEEGMALVDRARKVFGHTWFRKEGREEGREGKRAGFLC